MARAATSHTADRSNGEKAIEDDLHGLGIGHVVSPHRGNRQGALDRRTTARVPPRRQVANRQRKPDQDPQSGNTGETAPAWTALREPGAGPGAMSSPTTWSRSAPCWLTPASHAAATPPELSPQTFQVEVAEALPGLVADAAV